MTCSSLSADQGGSDHLSIGKHHLQGLCLRYLDHDLYNGDDENNDDDDDGDNGDDEDEDDLQCACLRYLGHDEHNNDADMDQ